MDGCCFMCYYAECHQKTVIVGSNRDYNEKRMFMALAVALTGVSMVVAAGNGELKIQSETSVQKVHAAGIHQIGVEPIPATGQITIEGSAGGTGWRDGRSQSTGRGVGSGGCSGRRSFRRGYERR